MQLTEENLKGKIYGQWEVIKYSHKVGYIKYFICKCLECGKEKPVSITNVIRGLSKSCGCKSRPKNAYNINKKFNEFDVIDKIVHVYIENDKDKIMLCDIDDWEKLKNCYWVDHDGYAVAIRDYQWIRFHRIVMNIDIPEIQVDHINGDRMDNRKENLRLCTNQENSRNKYKNSNNTSGYKGVYFDKGRNKWRASIMHNRKSIKSPRRYDTPEEAYQWYVEKSNELFGDFSVYKSRDKEVIRNDNTH